MSSGPDSPQVQCLEGPSNSQYVGDVIDIEQATTNGTDDETNDLLSPLDLYKDFIDLAKRAEEQKNKILKQEEVLSLQLRAKNKQESTAANNTKELLIMKEQLRSKHNRLNDSNETVCEQISTIKTLEIEVRELGSINSQINSAIKLFSSKIGEKQARIASLVPSIVGQLVECQTEIAGNQSSKIILGRLGSLIVGKIALAESKMAKACLEAGVYPYDSLSELIEEEKDLKKKIRELKAKIRPEVGPKSLKRSASSTGATRSARKRTK